MISEIRLQRFILRYLDMRVFLHIFLFVCMLGISNSFGISFVNYSATAIELKSMGSNILPDESEELLKVVSEDTPRTGFSEEEWLAIRNDALDVLFRQKKHSSYLFSTFRKSFNTTGKVAWRNYLIQNLDRLYSIAASKKEAEEVKSMLFSSLNNTESGIPSTALLTLVRMGYKDMGKLYSPVYHSKRILEKKFYSYIDKATALNILSDMDTDLARKYAIIYLTSEDKNDANLIFLKMASIHVLSRHGNSNDLKLLESFLSSTDSRLRLAASIAIKKRK